jgi:tetratricopeptide (TPR) repeat protein
VTTFSDLHEAALVASSQYDLSAALIAMGEGESAEELLRLALTTADSLPRRDLGAQIRLRLADLIAHRADQASPTGPTALAGAAGLLQEAVTDLLPGSDRAALAAAYLRLGQVQARQGEIADGTLNALRSRELLARAGSPSEQAEVFVTLGQLLLAQGDSLSAEETLLAVLDLMPDDPALLQRAAGLLVRLHQLRARRIPYGDPRFAQETALRARASRDRLAGLALAEHTAALDTVLKRLR